MRNTTPPPRLAEAMAAHGLEPVVQEFEQSTRTAADAAAAIGCDVAEIGKSLVFVGRDSGRAVVVIASGAARVDEAAVGAALGEPVRKADADEVRAATGYAIGGVPPFGHATEVPVFVERRLTAFETLWVAAGTPRTVFPIASAELVRIAKATVITA